MAKTFFLCRSFFACQRIAQNEQERKGLNQIKSDKKQKSSHTYSVLTTFSQTIRGFLT